MKRLLAISLLALSLSTVALAGEVPSPPAPPTCTENCPQSTTTTTVTTVVIEIVLLLITQK